LTARVSNITILLTCLIAVLLIGEFVSYSNPYYCNIDAKLTEDYISYSLDTNLSIQYTAVSLDNGGIYDYITEYVVLVDDKYPMNLSYEAFNFSLANISSFLSDAGLDLKRKSTDEIVEIIKTGIDHETSTAIFFIAGTLPSEIYDGTKNSIIFDWLKTGGVMYWGNGVLGKYVSEKHKNISTIPLDICSTLFFGKPGAINNTDVRTYEKNLINESLTDIMGVFYNECTFGIKTDSLDNSLGLDYSVDGFRSVSLTKYHDGSGMVVVFGGFIVKDSAPSIAQVIASSLNYSTKIIDWTNEMICGSTSNHLDYQDHPSIYIYLGKLQSIKAQYILF